MYVAKKISTEILKIKDRGQKLIIFFMVKKMRKRSSWLKKNQASQKQRTQAQIKKLHNDPFWLLRNENYSIDKLVSFENQLDDSWE